MNGDHQVQVLFLCREVPGLFAGGDNRMVSRDLLRIPDGTSQGGVGLGCLGLKTGNVGKGGNDPGCVTELLFGQIAAVGVRIRRQLLFIE